MKLTIAIIGAGNLGAELATRLVNRPYRLLLFDQDSQTAQALANNLLKVAPLADVEAIDCQVNASWEADIIVLAVPKSSKKALADHIRDVAICKIVISLSASTNDVHSEYRGEDMHQWLPNSKVVNVVTTDISAQYGIDGKAADAFVTGTNQAALATVSALLETAGLNPVVVEDWSVSDT